MTKEVPLSRGAVALVDIDDYEKIAAHKWYLSTNGYAVRNRCRKEGGGQVYMHRVILNAPAGLDVDHANHIKIDNRKSNLRLASRSQNLQNSRSRGGHSRYKGVTYDRSRGKWNAQAAIDGIKTYLGTFDSEKDAARAHDAAVRRGHGEFAFLNFPGEEHEFIEPKRRVKTSRYRGVTWNPRRGRWFARLSVDLKKHHLGYFDSEEEAAAAYQEARARLRVKPAEISDGIRRGPAYSPEGAK